VTEAGRKGRSQALKAQMELRDLVLSGELDAGDRVFEVPLSERLGISRTPLREALGRLEQEGLLDRLASGGYAVRTFSFDDVTDAIELRGVLEGTAARLAAERGTDEAGLRALLRIVADLDAVTEPGAEAMDFAAYAELNAAFHATLARLAGSDTIRREVERAAALPFASPSAFLDAQAALPGFRRSLVVAQAQHRGMAEAIAAREGARAEAIAREHARLARRNLDYVMTEDRSLIHRVPGLALVAT
jgi:GntR family transcriptional regulator of vanillate catabolism